MGSNMGGRIYRVAGREFVPVGPSSLRHDEEAMRLLGDLGLLDAGPPSGAAPEIVEQWVRSMTLKLSTSGRLADVLGFVVMPKGVEKWTPELAQETTEFLANQSDPKDRATVERLLTEATAYFFALARNYSTSSARSSRGAVMRAVAGPPA